ncbi:MAG: hypothetical protein ACE5GJ_12160 [Gemmatimonadota bacterium]
MKRLLLALTAALAAAACGQSADSSASQQAADTLTRRQKDSIISEMPLPGAGGVGRALDAVEKANGRAARHDSMR